METFIKINKSEKESLFEIMRTNKNLKYRKNAHIILLNSKKMSSKKLAPVFDMEANSLKKIIKTWKSIKLNCFL